MDKNIISPFHGEPLTTEFIDKNGNTAFRITPRVLTPLRVKLAEFLAGISFIIFLGFGVSALSAAHQPTDGVLIAAFSGLLLAYPILNWLSRWLLCKTTQLVLTTDEFKFQSWKGWQTYDRKLAHAFVMIDHDKTQTEKDEHDLEIRQGQARGQVIAKKRYYADSFHLSFEYLGQRNDVLTVYGRKEALAIQARLNTCDDILDGKANMGDGISLNPEDQWSDQPGDIS